MYIVTKTYGFGSVIAGRSLRRKLQRASAGRGYGSRGSMERKIIRLENKLKAGRNDWHTPKQMALDSLAVRGQRYRGCGRSLNTYPPCAGNKQAADGLSVGRLPCIRRPAYFAGVSFMVKPPPLAMRIFIFLVLSALPFSMRKSRAILLAFTPSFIVVTV